MHAALSLILTLFGVAVMYVSQEAQFLAAVQVIVYAGAIVVLFLFVIMLLGVDKAEDLHVEPFKLQRKVAVARRRRRDRADRVRGDLVARQHRPGQATAERCRHERRAARSHDSNIRALARDLFSDHVLAFELTSVLLVIAVVGTVLLARRAPKSTTESPT